PGSYHRRAHLVIAFAQRAACGFLGRTVGVTCSGSTSSAAADGAPDVAPCTRCPGRATSHSAPGQRYQWYAAGDNHRRRAAADLLRGMISVLHEDLNSESAGSRQRRPAGGISVIESRPYVERFHPTRRSHVSGAATVRTSG